MVVTFCELTAEWPLAILPARQPTIERALVAPFDGLSLLTPRSWPLEPVRALSEWPHGHCSCRQPTIDWALVGLAHVLSACPCMPRGWPFVPARVVPHAGDRLGSRRA